MSALAIVVVLVIAVPVLLFAIWEVMQAARVRIDSGTIGLLIVRGVATSRSLPPGVHWVWPYRKQLIQIYPLRELTYLTASEDQTTSDSDLVDEPFHCHLGDRTAAAVLYTIRFRLRPDSLQDIHERLGPEGIKGIVRDRSRQALLAGLGEGSRGFGDVFGDARAELQAALTAQMTEALAAEGFDVTLFTLRDLDLGTVGDMVQATVRSQAELEREQAAAAVRLARVRNEAEVDALLAHALADDVLRYRQIELWREIVQRWDGHSLLPQGPAAAAAGGVAPTTAAAIPPAPDEPPPAADGAA